ncbi:MAG: DegT/DnrJ/EryC1/StrS aminotransferase family protein [Candidatus Latescibacteria bacterium]|nr:DegT/DnrJ/EryC1/StrS aminotransferase family protein [Candidatus Latescibacterota bacterium]
MEERIQIFKPWFGPEEHEALRAPLETGWLGTGPHVQQFEQQFAEYIGVRHAIALNSCTAALHLAMLVSGVEGGEVLTTPMTFVSSNHAILHAGGRPVFCDIEADTLNIDATQLERLVTPSTRAILAVHYGGHPCDLDPILALGRRRGIPVIEDAAQACGGRYGNRRLGSLGKIGCFSFESKKNLSTGDGGMLTTDDDDIAERIRRLRWMGISRGTWERFHGAQPARNWEYEVDEAGFKYAMNDIAASLGLVQLGKLETGNQHRRRIVERYCRAFSQTPDVEPLAHKNYGQSACYSMVVKVDARDALCDHLEACGVESGVHFYPNHLYPAYKPYRVSLPVAEEVWQRILTLPLYPHLTQAQQDKVIEGVLSFAGQLTAVGAS